MKKLKNGCHFFNIDCTEKFQITDLPQSLDLCFSKCSHGNGISALVIMKKLKNGCHFFNIDHMEKFQITNLPKVWISGFPSVDGNGISESVIMKKLKNRCHFFNIDHMENFQITNLPQSLDLWFSECPRGNRISPSVIMKKLKNGCHFFNIDHMYRQFQITNPPKVWISAFPSVHMEMEYQHQSL